MKFYSVLLFATLTSSACFAEDVPSGIECLAQNIYHEARSEDIEGQQAVAWVTLNRLMDKQYPDTICEVVHQSKTDKSGNPIKNKCAFSWYCDGKSDKITDQEAYRTALDVALDAIMTYGVVDDPTKDAIMYHAEYVDPYWTSSYVEVITIDTHIFYSRG